MLRSPAPRRLAVLLWLSASFAGCAAARDPSGTAAGRGDRPPAEAFFADPPLSRVRLSPDGARVVGVTSREGRRVLIAKPIGGEEIVHLGKFEVTERRVASLGWSGDVRVLVGLERLAPRGDAFRVVEMSAFQIARWRPPRVGAPWGLRVSPVSDAEPVLHWLPDDPDHVLVNAYDVDAQALRARRASVRNGDGAAAAPLVPEVRTWFADATGRVRAAAVSDHDELGVKLLARAGEAEPLRPLADADLAREASLGFAGFAADPGTLYVHATTEAGRRGVYRYALAAQRRGALVASDPVYDVGRLVALPGDARPIAVEIASERPELRFLGGDAAREQATIDATFPGTTNRITEVDRRGATALVEVSGDTAPPRFYVYDREAREMLFFFAAYPALEGEALAEMRPVRFAARDGLEIAAYLTLPPGATPRGLPAVVIPHDGPTARDVWGFDARVQFLASRGFAVLQPNYRGSSGYGWEFERAGYAEWGGAMQHDLADAAAWLVERGIADPDRIGVFGVGYGGYAALMSAVATPGVFRAVASWGGITDLVDLIERPGRHDASDPNAPLVWANPREPGALAALSPRHRAGEIRVPVLLGHGSVDRVVHAAQAEAMASALEAAGGEVTLRTYRGETHDLRVERHRIDFHEALAAFFTEHLAPHAEGTP